MKSILTIVCAALAFLLPSLALGGEADVTERFRFDTSFETIVRAIKGHEDEVLLGSLGAAEVIEKKGDEIKVKVETPKRTAYFTLRLKEDIDFRTKKAEFTTMLVETDGFVTHQHTSVQSQEKNGKMYVTVRVRVVVPTVGNKLIHWEVKRSIQKLVRKIDRLL